MQDQVFPSSSTMQTIIYPTAQLAAKYRQTQVQYQAAARQLQLAEPVVLSCSREQTCSPSRACHAAAH